MLDRTPLYAESGGQQADHGHIRLANGALIEVTDVQRPITGLVVHRATVLEGEAGVGEDAEAEVDVVRRRSISRAHTATHMVHQALRDELGDTATQAGSENSPGRLRFDFKSLQAVPAAAMGEIEARINAVLLDDLPVTADVMAIDAAKKLGAMALFGEKYGERVRVVSIGEWSRELCVGTHTPRVGQIGVVKLLGESSIGSGRAPRRGARGCRRVLPPRPRGHDRQPADRHARGAPRRAARPHRDDPRPAARRREGDRGGAPEPGARGGVRSRRSRRATSPA